MTLFSNSLFNRFSMRPFLLISCLLLVFSAAWLSHPPHVLAPFALADKEGGATTDAPQFNSRFVSSHTMTLSIRPPSRPCQAAT